MLFCLALLVGVVLFVVWAVKHLSKEKLKKTVIWLLVIGVIGCLVTGGCSKGRFHKGYKDGGAKYEIMVEVMGEHNLEVDVEEMEEIMKEVMEKKKESWRKK